MIDQIYFKKTNKEKIRVIFALQNENISKKSVTQIINTRNLLTKKEKKSTNEIQRKKTIETTTTIITINVMD